LLYLREIEQSRAHEQERTREIEESSSESSSQQSYFDAVRCSALQCIIAGLTCDSSSHHRDLSTFVSLPLFFSERHRCRHPIHMRDRTHSCAHHIEHSDRSISVYLSTSIFLRAASLHEPRSNVGHVRAHRYSLFSMILSRFRRVASVDTATYCNILQHTATYCNPLQHSAAHCTTLHHTATHCNILTLQRTATHL